MYPFCLLPGKLWAVPHKNTADKPNERRIIAYLSSGKFLLVKRGEILVHSAADCSVIWEEGLNKDLPGEIAASGSPCNLCDELKYLF